MSSSDVETFNGKIVYNLDGSAFIIDAGNATVSSLSLSLSGVTPTPTPTGIHTTTTRSQLVGGGKEADRLIKSSEDRVRLRQGQTEADNGNRTGSGAETGAGTEAGAETDYQLSPKIHSFRVVSAQDANTQCQDPANAFQTNKHRSKPILMCFICKLSFGNVNSFSLHAKTEHRLNLEELEQQLLNREYSSAIIQRNMDEKPQISFLQPLDVNQIAGTGTGGGTAGGVDVGVGVDAGSGGNFVESMEDQNIAASQILAENRDDDRDQDDRDAPKVAVKSTVKLSSLNLATSKTNTPIKTTSTTTTTPASSLSSSISSCVSPVATVRQKETDRELELEPAERLDENKVEATVSDDSPLNLVDQKATSTDNLSSDKSITKRSQGARTSSPNDPPSPTASPSPFPSSHQAPAPVSASDHQNQPMDLDAESTAADILHQHLLSLQEQQQQQVIATEGVFPPIQSQAQAQAQAHLSSFHASLAALANEQNARGVKLLTDFLQQQLQHQQQQQQQQQQQHLLFPTTCSDHPDFKGVDCKTCELMEIQPLMEMKSPATSQFQSQSQSQSQTQSQSQPQRSPNNNSSGGLSSSMPISPSASSVASVGNPTASSFTIGACSEHINGRPQGVDCAR